MFLEQLSQPLDGFQKMNKTLRMLSISTKIESSRLGELGSGFVNLAMDVEKLSYQVNEKSSAIMSHQQLMATLISSTLAGFTIAEENQNIKVSFILGNMAESLQKLVSLNDRSTQFGREVSNLSEDITNSISEVVSSMQSHDSTRQQLEHIVEALEHLSAGMSKFKCNSGDESSWRDLVVEAGDVCELQSAQLRFSVSEFCSAVRTIVANLKDVAQRQSLMAGQILNITGAADSDHATVVENIGQGMTEVTDILDSCAASDREMSVTMTKVVQTIKEITLFVSDIEQIGSEIDLIAMNAQIKAAHTGREGAALGVLAEAIKRLSDDSVRQTDSVAASLKGIIEATDHLSEKSENEDERTVTTLTTMQGELMIVLESLGNMNGKLFTMLSDLGERVTELNNDVEQATGAINVDVLAREMTDGVLVEIDSVVTQARRLVPASNEFKKNLQHMEKLYTMESERHIHESIARKRGVSLSTVSSQSKKTVTEEASEFGENVDLF
jgi:methyl-accepting chemotaxis protein